jgi:DNA-directed RNA polymerase subunit L
LEIEIISSEEKMLKFRVTDEDHTLGNLVQDVLLNDDRVKGAGFTRPHPLRKEIVFSVFLNNGDPLTVLRENVAEMKKFLGELTEAVEKAEV